jgi:DNA-directed RNA polymerase subunit alpha
VGEVLEVLNKGEEAMLAIRNFGEKSLDELRDKLREKGYMKDVPGPVAVGPADGQGEPG